MRGSRYLPQRTGGTYYMASTIRPRYIDAMELPSVSRSDLSHSRRSAQSLIGERRKVPRKWLMSGPCTVAEAASLFSMSSRPLTRHLEAEGLTFRDLTNEARFAVSFSHVYVLPRSG